MRKIAAGVFQETGYAGVHLGVITTQDGLMLVDSPLRGEDGRDWLMGLNDLGRPRYLALLDSHPDRVLGARGLDVPLVAHETTMETIRTWPDAFKGGAHPIGAEADRLKRITGVQKAIPEIVFTEEMILSLGEREIHLTHQPGPRTGSIWIRLPKSKTIFIGDAVTVSEPPYIGESDVEVWLETLGLLRDLAGNSYKLISSRDGRVNRDHINRMARFLRKIPPRLENFAKAGRTIEMADRLAGQLLKDYKIPAARRNHLLLRLSAGLSDLYSYQNPEGGK